VATSGAPCILLDIFSSLVQSSCSPSKFVTKIYIFSITTLNIMSPTVPTLLSLPQELRDLIYDFYPRSPGGYIHSFESNKLLQADGRIIELSFAFTCRQIASEMAGLALAANAIIFSTHFSEATRENADCYNSAIKRKQSAQVSLLKAPAPKLLTPSMAAAAAKRFPAFLQALDSWLQHDAGAMRPLRRDQCGEAPSLFMGFVQLTLDLLSQHEDFVSEAAAVPDIWKPSIGCRVEELCKAPSETWIVASFD